MYLMNLSEKVKKTFLELAYLIAVTDNCISEEEKIVLEAYKSELQIDYDFQTINTNLNLETVLRSLCQDANETEKKIIVFEIIGLAMTDSLYDDEEKKTVIQINEAFRLDDAYPAKCETMISRYIELQTQIDALVTGN